MNEITEDDKPKPVRWNKRRKIVTGFVSCGIVAAVVALFPEYGIYNRYDKREEVAAVVAGIDNKTASLKAAIDNLGDSLGSKLAEKDSVLKETVSDYNRQLGSLSSEHEKARERLAKEHERREAAARAELERVRGASLDLVQYPGFDRNRDYISSIGYWGSKPSNGALDFEEYVTLKRSLEFMLEGRPKRMIDDVLNGRALLMSGEVARQKTRDITVRDGVKYFFATDVNGNPKGFGMDFDQYEREIGGK